MPAHDLREVIVDDNDGTVNYIGPWFLTDGKDYDSELSGKPYGNSLHGISGNGSLSYTFRGSSGRILGTADFSSSSSSIDPTWECLLDGIRIPTQPPPPSRTNHWPLCEWDLVPVGSHEIVVNVKSKGTTFWFDQVVYIPDPTFVIVNADILVSYSDAALEYNSGWQPSRLYNDSLTAAEGAVINFPFFGSGISWYGTIPSGASRFSSSGSFSIDGIMTTNFSVVGYSDNHETQSNQLFFKTPRLSLEQHTITVTSNTDSDTSPLNLAYLVVDNGRLPDPSAPFTTSLPADAMILYEHRDDFPRNMLILGGIALFLLIVAAILFFRRRTRRKRLESPESPKRGAHKSAQDTNTPMSESYTAGVQDYPFALQQQQQGGVRHSISSSISNSITRFASISTRPNSLFPTLRLSALPTKRPPSAASSSQTYRPYTSRPWFDSLSRSSSGSSATLLDYANPTPSRKLSMKSVSEDQTVVDEKEPGHRPAPEAIDPPNYTSG